jgi:hypothetical protein
MPTTNFTDWCGEWQRNAGLRDTPEPDMPGTSTLYDEM